MKNLKKIKEWRGIETLDTVLSAELNLPDDKISKNFDSNIKFGTMGIMGKMGAGTDKINAHTVAAVAEAYASFLLKSNTDKLEVVIGYDNRTNSSLFANIVARVLLQNNITPLLVKEGSYKSSAYISYIIMKKQLNGGVYISAAPMSKEYNGIKLYGSNGAQLQENDTDLIQKSIDDIDAINVSLSDEAPLIIGDEYDDPYLSDVLSVQKNLMLPKINVAFSPLNGISSEQASKLVSEMGHKICVVSKQESTTEDFKHSKIQDPMDGRSFKKVEFLARKEKADVMVVVDSEAGSFRVAVKYQKRYKFLSGNQMACLYLEYLLTELKKSNQLPTNGYIVSSITSSTLAEKISKKFGVKFIKTHSGFKNIAAAISGEDGIFLFAFEESCGFLINPNISRDRDAFQGLVAMTEMVAYYKTQKINVYDKLKTLYKSYGIHRTVKISRSLNLSEQNKLIKTFMKAKYIGDEKVAEKIDYREEPGSEKIVKIIFKNGSWIAIGQKMNEKEVDIYIENVGRKTARLIDVVSFEKEVEDFVDGATEVFEDKKWSWRAFGKYSIFISIIALIMVFVFMYVYKSASGSDTAVFSVFSSFYHQMDVWIWVSLWAYVIFMKFIGAWTKKRMFDQLKVKVKLRHIMVSQMMGGIIAFVTPFAIGGDAIGYWYLRRKGVKRAPLIATLASATIWLEMKYALQTLFLFGIGINFYKEIFNNSNPEAHAALILFFIGLAWGIFSSSMIFILSTSRRIQEFIVRNSVKLLEWFPLYHISDPGLLSSGVQRQFKMVRAGTKKIWKKPTFILEMIIYDVAPVFLSPSALAYANAGLINQNVASGPYWSQLVAGDISGTANSMSLTPGGSGTWEWLSVNINEHLFNNTKIAINDNVAPKTIAAASDLATKVVFQWPDLILSSLLIMIATLTIRKKPFKFLKGNRKYVFTIFVVSTFATSLLCMLFLI